MSDIPNVKNFSYSEFGCKCGQCAYKSGCDIYPMIPLLAQQIRDVLRRPLRVNSACRCDVHNVKIGSSLSSQHVAGQGFRAMDLDIKNSNERAIAIKIALSEGASVGVNKDFLHFDFRDNGPIVFTY